MKDKLEAMELKPNMYVRTNDGYISNVNNINDKNIYNNNFLKLGIIKKSSYDIIDLIEEDDLIKCQFGEQTLILQVGARYTTSYLENGFVKGVFTPDNEFWSLEVLVEEDILQSIVTKEQFSSIEYRLGDDK